MNCRRINGLLSAYLDSELTGAEMLEIRAHLDQCGGCLHEYETLRETKRLVASLASKAPRAELEALLLAHASRAPGGEWGAFAGRLGQWLVGPSHTGLPLYLRPRMLSATAVLSLAGLWLASTALDGPGDHRASFVPQRGGIEWTPAPATLTVSAPPVALVTSGPLDPTPVGLVDTSAAPPPVYRGGMFPSLGGLLPAPLTRPSSVSPLSAESAAVWRQNNTQPSSGFLLLH